MDQKTDQGQHQGDFQEKRDAGQDRRLNMTERRKTDTPNWPADKERRFAQNRRQDMSDRRQMANLPETEDNTEAPPETPLEETPSTATGKDGKIWQINPHKAIVKLTDGSQIAGTINVIGNNRLSDMFTKSASPFIVLYNANMQGRGDRVVVINKHQIVFASPED
jgi:hypothetical protein